MSEDTDVQLLLRIAGQDQRALRQFYERFHGVVYQFSMRTVANAADAAEVLNEVMLEVWRRAASFQGQSQVRTWLLSITRHKSIDLLRRKRPTELLDEASLDEGEEEASCPMSLAIELGQQGEQVRVCLDRLKDSHRQVVYLTFFEELSYPEIAEIMAIPNGTVKTRMLHAKQQLLQCLRRLLGGAEA
ncbi:sigma-70 family RNA polymerase sigma factor [Aquipseudomonas guryensis]|jgi:RNA polymerase sigma-70 factor (ECF subfamily)|uniref:Sigma-70 family RNA polymerase sigma factor n=1 Tax=Aquipseudomonas guryensis TaxID=2759165 RepID=A0A7W4DA18_9GAMM|nr:sigma-70 family RNA polymerase sigma factor [Pseudomonas guryensis]MBB1518765.1 sigma-70 family RNA polymerase sigma factor [Pseudomonas guryensis]